MLTFEKAFPVVREGGEAKFSTGKFKFFSSGLIYGIYSHGCGGTRVLKYMCQIDTPYNTANIVPSHGLSR